MMLPSSNRPTVRVTYGEGNSVSLHLHKNHPKGVLYTLTVIEKSIPSVVEYRGDEYKSAVADYRWEQNALMRRVNNMSVIERKE